MSQSVILDSWRVFEHAMSICLKNLKIGVICTKSIL